MKNFWARSLPLYTEKLCGTLWSWLSNVTVNDVSAGASMSDLSYFRSLATSVMVVALGVPVEPVGPLLSDAEGVCVVELVPGIGELLPGTPVEVLPVTPADELLPLRLVDVGAVVG